MHVTLPSELLNSTLSITSSISGAIFEQHRSKKQSHKPIHNRIGHVIRGGAGCVQSFSFTSVLFELTEHKFDICCDRKYSFSNIHLKITKQRAAVLAAKGRRPVNTAITLSIDPCFSSSVKVRATTTPLTYIYTFIRQAVTVKKRT